MAKAKDLAGLAALGALGYMLNKKGDSSKTDTGDETERLAKRGDRMSNEDYIKSRMKKAPLDDTDKYPSGVMGGAKQANAVKPASKSDSKLQTITTRKDPREAEAGMSRGTRTTSMAGAGRGSVNPPSVSATDPRSAEAGMSRGTRTTSTAGAGRGLVNPPSVSATNPRSAEAGMSRGTRPPVVGGGRGTVNPPSVTPQQPAREAEAGMSRGTRNMTPSPGQADIDKIRRIQEASRIPSSMAGRPGYDEAGNPMKKGGMTKMASGGMTASRRADGIASRGKTRGKIC